MIAEQVLITALKLALDATKKVASEQDFKAIADEVINSAEGYFPEGSLLDTAVEVTADAVRDFYDIKDSDPDN